MSAVYTVWAVSQPWGLRGIVLRLSLMAASGTVSMLRLMPLGSHLRMSALFCSLVGRCQGEWGSRKNTSTPVSDSMRC